MILGGEGRSLTHSGSVLGSNAPKGFALAVIAVAKDSIKRRAKPPLSLIFMRFLWLPTSATLYVTSKLARRSNQKNQQISSHNGT